MAAVTGFETEYGNFVTEAYAISSLVGEAYVAKSFGMSVVQTEQFPDNTNTIRVPIDGYVTAQIVAESTAPTVDGDGELTESYVACTAAKSALPSNISVEALRFGGNHADIRRLVDKHASAHARRFDTSLKALFPSLSQSVTATNILTKDNLLDARYYIESGTEGHLSGLMVGAFDYKAIGEVRKELTNTTATAFMNLELLSLVGRSIPGVLPVGEFSGIQIYATSGLSTSGGDDVAAVWDPMQCFYAGVDVGNGINLSLTNPSVANGITYELLSWTFFKPVIWRAAAGCKVLSDT